MNTIHRSPIQHFNIPIFIPEEACPFRCVFCNQYNISGRVQAPEPKAIAEIIRTHLSTIPREHARVEVAFFGGSFTGLAPEKQIYYLETIVPWLKQGRVDSIRVSTRPDYITEDILGLLWDHGVRSIELGAQSMDDHVLKMAGRGHNAQQVADASQLILKKGFELGLQMMIGLPGDTRLKSWETARKIIELGASSTRIYPCLVIRQTDLAEYYAKGTYHPLELSHAVELTAELFSLFSTHQVKVLRMGLHPSEGLQSGAQLLAGPYHPAFGELVMTEVWKKRFQILRKSGGACIRIYTHPASINAAIGHKAQNRLWLLQAFEKVKFIGDPTLTKNEFYVDYC